MRRDFIECEGARDTPWKRRWLERIAAIYRTLRAPVIGRKLSFGNDSWTGARLTGHMYSVLGTLKRHEIDLEHWLHDWLSACAEAARAPPDLTPWLPRSMDPARRQRFQQPRASPVHG